MSYAVMVSGEALPMPSPCGVNCSYTMEFEGPYLGCDNSSSTDWYNTTTYQNTTGNLTMTLYEGSVYDAGTGGTLGAPVVHNGTYSTNFYNASTRYPLLANEAALMDQQNTSVLARTDSVICSFQRAKYTINHEYINSVHSRTIIAEPIDKLVNLIPDTYDEVLIVPGIGTPTGETQFGTGPANWSAANLAIYRDFQHCMLIEAMTYYIEGDFTGYASATANTTNSTTTPGFLKGLGWSNGVAGQSYVPGPCLPLQARNPRLL